MKPVFIALTACLVFGLQARAGELSNAQAEKILGIAGVSHAPSKTLALDVEYRDQSGQKLFSLRVTEPKIYEVWKAGAKKAEPVSGLGQDAFAQPTLRQVCARTATTAACANALFMDPKVTQQHLVELVRAAL